MRRIFTILFLMAKMLALGIDPSTFMNPTEYNSIECIPTKESIIYQIDSLISATDVSLVTAKVLYYDVKVTLFLDNDSITNPQRAKLSTKKKYVIKVLGRETIYDRRYILHYNSRKYMFDTYVIDSFSKTSKSVNISFPLMQLFDGPSWKLTYVDGKLSSAYYEYGDHYIHVDLLNNKTYYFLKPLYINPIEPLNIEDSFFDGLKKYYKLDKSITEIKDKPDFRLECNPSRIK